MPCVREPATPDAEVPIRLLAAAAAPAAVKIRL
jgi:hypothetical protein